MLNSPGRGLGGILHRPSGTNGEDTDVERATRRLCLLLCGESVCLALLVGTAGRLLLSDLTNETPSVSEVSSLLNGRRPEGFRGKEQGVLG